jgi:hypothetical protein
MPDESRMMMIERERERTLTRRVGLSALSP